MANSLFASFKQQLGLATIGALNAAGTVIKATLVDTGAYTFNAAHTVIGDIPVGARIATGTLANKTWTGAVFDADDRIALEEAIHDFSPREQEVIRMRFVDGLTQVEIAAACENATSCRAPSESVPPWL